MDAVNGRRRDAQQSTSRGKLRRPPIRQGEDHVTPQEKSSGDSKLQASLSQNRYKPKCHGTACPLPSRHGSHIGFGEIHGPKPCEFIGSGDIHGPKPYEFIGFTRVPGIPGSGRTLVPGVPASGYSRVSCPIAPYRRATLPTGHLHQTLAIDTLGFLIQRRT
jgi:hypothetical protein